MFVADDSNTCTDGNVCTTDSCSAGACVQASSGVCSVAGTVFYYRDSAGAGTEPTSKPVPNVGIDNTQDAVADVTTGSSGTYSFGSSYGNVSLTTVDKYGSPRASDHNGAITGTDAAQIARSVVGLVTLSPNQRIAGDVTGNGTISGLDAANVARFAALLVDHFPVAIDEGSDWKFARCDAYAYPGDPGCGAPSYAFTPIAQAESGKNFYAMLYGDVTGNWQPAALFSSAKMGVGERLDVDAATLATASPQVVQDARARPLVRRDASASPALLSFDALPNPLKAGERRQVTVRVANGSGILALDLSLKFDASRWAIVGVQSNGVAAGWGVAHSGARGTHRISTYGVSPLAGDGTVLTVTVEALSNQGRALPLEMSAVANEGAIPVRVQQRVGPPRTDQVGEGDRP